MRDTIQDITKLKGRLRLLPNEIRMASGKVIEKRTSLITAKRNEDLARKAAFIRVSNSEGKKTIPMIEAEAEADVDVCNRASERIKLEGELAIAQADLAEKDDEFKAIRKLSNLWEIEARGSGQGY